MFPLFIWDLRFMSSPNCEKKKPNFQSFPLHSKKGVNINCIVVSNFIDSMILRSLWIPGRSELLIMTLDKKISALKYRLII